MPPLLPLSLTDWAGEEGGTAELLLPHSSQEQQSREWEGRGYAAEDREEDKRYQEQRGGTWGTGFSSDLGTLKKTLLLRHNLKVGGASMALYPLWIYS